MFLSNGFLQINTKMKNKNLLIFGIVLSIVLQGGFVLAGDLATFNSSEIHYKISEDGNSATLTFVKEGLLNIQGVEFKNIRPPSSIEITNEGKILEADLTTNEKGGIYNINGNIFKVPPNSRLVYTQDVFILPPNSKVNNFNLDKKTKIEGQQIQLPDNSILNGEATLLKEGYLIKNGDITYNKLKIMVDKTSGNVLICKEILMNLSDYKGNWIKQTFNNLEMKSSEQGIVNLQVLPSNELFNSDEIDFVAFQIKNGDGLSIEKRQDKHPLVFHKSSDQGSTLILNGFSAFEFNKSGMYVKKSSFSLEPLSAITIQENSNFNLLKSSFDPGIPIEIKSDAEKLGIKDNTLKINQAGELIVVNDKENKIISYNENLNQKLEDSPSFNLERISGPYKDVVFDKLLPQAFESGLTIDQTSDITKLIIENVNNKPITKDLLESVVPDILYSSTHYNHYNSDQAVSLIEGVMSSSAGKFKESILYQVPGDFLYYGEEIGFTPEQLNKFVFDYSNGIGTLAKEHPEINIDDYNSVYDGMSVYFGKTIDILKQENISPDTTSTILNFVIEESIRLSYEKKLNSYQEVTLSTKEQISLFYNACKKAGISRSECIGLLKKFL